MTLEELVRTIAKKKEVIAEEKALATIPHPEVVRQKRGNINRAKEDIKSLMEQYCKEVQNKAAFIIAVGDQSLELAESAQKNFGCFGLDGEVLYKEVCTKVPEFIYLNKPSSSSLFDHFSSRFNDRAMEIGIIGYPRLGFEPKYKKRINTQEDFLNLMKRAFNEKIGAEVVGIDAVNRVALTALDEGYAGGIVPIMMYTKDEELVLELTKGLSKLTKNVFVVSVGADVSEKINNISIANIDKVNKTQIESTLVKIRENLI